MAFGRLLGGLFVLGLLVQAAAIADRPIPRRLTLEQKVCISTHILRLRAEPGHTYFETWKPAPDGKLRLLLSPTEVVAGQIAVTEASVLQDLIAPNEQLTTTRIYVSGLHAPSQRREMIFFLVWDPQRSKELGKPSFLVSRHPMVATTVEHIDAETIARLSKLSSVVMDEPTGFPGPYECQRKRTLDAVARIAS